MAFTEFCCRSGGSNMNGGGLASNGQPATSPVYTQTNGAYSTVTHKFVPITGNPSLTVTVGDFAHVFTDGSTTPTYIARVTAVDTVSITLSTSAKSGTEPTTAAAGITCNVGGAWLGPSGTVKFPFDFVLNAMVNSTSNPVRINFKNDTAPYAISTGITWTFGSTFSDRAWTAQGYTSTFGDGGKFNIDGSTNAILIMTITDRGPQLRDCIISNNGTTGTNIGLYIDGNQCSIQGVTVHDTRGNGIETAGSQISIIDCETYLCNKSSTAAKGGIAINSSSVRCHQTISHDNTGFGFNSNASIGDAVTYTKCIADTNTSDGFLITNVTGLFFDGCDAYGNTGDGLDYATASGNCNGVIRNCNFVLNGGYGINGGSGNRAVFVQNCGFVDNTTAATTGTSLQETGRVNYTTATTPYNAPTTGDFRIALTAAKGTGYGTYTETQASYTGTVGYPDIGAAQHQDSGGTAGASRARISSGF